MLTSIKNNLNTNEMVNEIRYYVQLAISFYVDDNIAWKSCARKVDILFNALILMGLKEYEDTNETFNILSDITHRSELFKYSRIASYLIKRNK